MEILKHKNSFKIKTNKFTISLDSESKDADFSFLSHSHSDHLFRAKKETIMSDETLKLAKFRGYEFNKLNDIPKNIQLLDSGHMIGSKALFMQDSEESTLFTGDFSINNSGFNNPFKPVKCDNLIIESTFGKPEFIFPKAMNEIKRAKDFIEDNKKKDYLTVLMGYPYGKIQEIQKHFCEYSKIMHPDVKKCNNLLNSLGFDFPTIEDSAPDILFSPSINSKNEYFAPFKRKTGIKFAVFSGWNLNPYYKKRFGADEGFTISDHADFKELLSTVKKSKAKNVYVHHGYSKEFKEFLRIEGVNAIDL
jgi:putative mRNA 3-end processing factor